MTTEADGYVDQYLDPGASPAELYQNLHLNHLGSTPLPKPMSALAMGARIAIALFEARGRSSKSQDRIVAECRAAADTCECPSTAWAYASAFNHGLQASVPNLILVLTRAANG